MEALGDAVVAGEAPHGDDLAGPSGKSVTQLHELRQAGLAQLVDGAQEARDQDLALPASAMLLQKQVAEPLFEAVNEFQRGIFFQIGGEPELLIGAQIVAVAAHQRQQPAVLTGGIDLAPAVQEVMVDDADHMEAVGHVGKTPDKLRIQGDGAGAALASLPQLGGLTTQ